MGIYRTIALMGITKQSANEPTRAQTENSSNNVELGRICLRRTIWWVAPQLRSTATAWDATLGEPCILLRWIELEMLGQPWKQGPPARTTTRAPPLALALCVA